MRKTGAVAHLIVFSRPHQSYRGCQPAGFSSFTAFCFFPSILGSSGSVSPTYRDVCRIMKYFDIDKEILHHTWNILTIFLWQQIIYLLLTLCAVLDTLLSPAAWYSCCTSRHLLWAPGFTFFFFFFYFVISLFCIFVFFVFCLHITKVCVVSVCQEEHLLSMLAMLLLNWNILFLL